MGRREMIGREAARSVGGSGAGASAAPGMASALCGGDLVLNVSAVPCARAAHPHDLHLYDLSQEQAGRPGLLVPHCFGSHALSALGPV